jgi:DNA recombination protein RmuC
MVEILVPVVLVFIAGILFLQILLIRRPSPVRLDLFEVISRLELIQQSVQQADRGIRDEFSRMRQESIGQQQAFKLETASSLKHQNDLLLQQLAGARTATTEQIGEFRLGVEQRLEAIGSGTNQKIELLTSKLASGQKAQMDEIRATMESRLNAMSADNERRLEQMRQTVEEKLQGTLEARLGESFRQVSERLEQVHKGLGEMRTLASGVGDLKRVLTNVKTRGTWGEVQLGSLLEQMLTPEQFARNVSTTGTQERVEFAIKLPGQGNNEGCWLPVDAKFPVEDYQRIVEASESGDADAVDEACRALEKTLRSCAKTISQKYLLPPQTTDFAILFLPTEGLYAEALRRTGLAEALQREYRVILTGPDTFAAILNSLQIGFKTLAIERRSSEVWKTLGAVKTQFEKYGTVLAKVKKKLQEASNTVDEAETRTRVLHRELLQVESRPEGSSESLIAALESSSVESAELAGEAA